MLPATTEGRLWINIFENWTEMRSIHRKIHDPEPAQVQDYIRYHNIKYKISNFL